MTTDIINNTVRYVQQTLVAAEGGHDWWHIQRVWHNAQRIAEQEGGNPLVIELGALLHDIADAKFHGGDEEIGPRRAQAFLESEGADPSVTEAIVHIIRYVSFRKGTAADNPELAVVQDADRLDAIGAIGIARAFSYGGHRGCAIYDPTIDPRLNLSSEEYKSSLVPTVNHFYEKLLRLKDKMNTETGRRMAEERHRFMEQYLAQFFREVPSAIQNP